MIKALHLDDRLIHGQVAISWTRFLDANVLLVINDEIMKNEMRKKALKMAVPPGVKYGFRGVEEGIAFLNGPESQKYRIMALVSTPVDAAKVCKGVNGIERLTVGGVRKKADYITDNLNLTKEDVEALLSVVEAGIPVGMLPTPRDKFVNLEKLLRKASGGISHMFMKAFLVALIAGICKIDNRVFGMTMIQRPLIVGTLVGFIYGNPVEGMIIGAQFELLSMGLVGIGAHSGMPEITLGSALCTGFVLGSGTGTEVALALALPISTFGTTIGYLTWIPLNHLLSERAKSAAERGDAKTMEICQWMGLFNYFFFPFLVVLLGMLVGAPLFEYLIRVIPAFITDGIKVASNMLPALGFALLMQLTYNRELAPFLFVGFVIVAFLGMSNVGVAIIGAILAVLIFNFSDRGNKEVSVDVDEI